MKIVCYFFVTDDITPPLQPCEWLRLVGRSIGRQVDRHTGRLVGRQVDIQVGRWADIQVGRQVGQQTGSTGERGGEVVSTAQQTGTGLPMEKLEIPTRNFENGDPPLNFKPFPLCDGSRHMGLLPKTYTYPIIFFHIFVKNKIL